MLIKIYNPFKKEEDRPTPLLVYNWRIYFVGLISSFAALEIGYDSGFIGGTLALDSFRKEFGFDRMSESHSSFIISNIVSLFHAGCFFGSILSYPITFYKGRKVVLISSALFMALGAVLMLISNKDRGLGPIYAGRILAGIGVGQSTSIVPTFLSEISPPPIRGRVSAMYEIGWRTGDLIGFWVSYAVDENMSTGYVQWILPFAIQIIPAALYLALVWWVKESPRWLFSVGKDSEAIENLKFYRKLDDGNDYLLSEISSIKELVNEAKKKVGTGIAGPFLILLREPKLQKRLLVTASLYVFQNLLGVQSINYYSPIIFGKIGVDGTNATLFSTGMFGVVKYIATIIWLMFIVEQIGRRNTLLYVSPICAVCFFYIGAYLKVEGGAAAGRAALGLMYVWCFFFIIGWSGTPYIVGAEVFDNSLRASFQAINSMFLWLSVFFMTRFTTDMIEGMDYGIFFFFASMALISIPWVYFLLPETKGIPLENMEELFDYPAPRAHILVFNSLKCGLDILQDKADESSLTSNGNLKQETIHVEKVV